MKLSWRISAFVSMRDMGLQFPLLVMSSVSMSEGCCPPRLSWEILPVPKIFNTDLQAVLPHRVAKFTSESL